MGAEGILIIAVLAALATLGALYRLSRNYIKVPPNKLAIVVGRKHIEGDGTVRGYRLVCGGAFFRVPVLERVDYMSLNLFTIPLEAWHVKTLSGGRVAVKGVANVKIKSDAMSLNRAVERFLGMTSDQIQKIILQVLDGHLRKVLSKLTVEELKDDHAELALKLVSEAVADLDLMGVAVENFAVEDITEESVALRGAE